MTEQPRENIEDLKKVAGGADKGIDHGSGQDSSDPKRTPKTQPGFGDGGKAPGFGDQQKPTGK